MRAELTTYFDLFDLEVKGEPTGSHTQHAERRSGRSATKINRHMNRVTGLREREREGFKA